MHVCVCVFGSVYVYVHADVCILVYTCMYVCACACVCFDVSNHVNMCLCRPEAGGQIVGTRGLARRVNTNIRRGADRKVRRGRNVFNPAQPDDRPSSDSVDRI